MSIHCLSNVNLPIHYQSVNPQPFGQSNVNFWRIHLSSDNIWLIRQYIGTHWHRSCQSSAYRRTKAALNLGTSLLLGPTNSLNGGWFRTKYYPTTSPIHCHNVNPAPIRVGSPTYLMEQVLQGTIRSVSTEDDSDNPFPMRCHSSANPFLILDQCVNPRPICQSNVNPGLIRQSIANTDAMCSTDQAPDPLQLPQYSANLPIQCQSSVNHTPIGRQLSV